MPSFLRIFILKIFMQGDQMPFTIVRAKKYVYEWKICSGRAELSALTFEKSNSFYAE